MLRFTLLLPLLVLAALLGLAHAEPAMPWSVTRSVRPDVEANAAPSPPPAGGMLFGMPLAATPSARTQAAPRHSPHPGLPAEAASEPSVEPVSPALNPFADGRLGALEAVRARPLFARSRQPPDTAPPPVVEALANPVAARPPAPDLHLIGIVEGIDTLAAVLKRPNGDRVTLHLGETIDSWTVAAIGPQSLTLREGEHEQSYTVFGSRATEALTNNLGMNVPGAAKADAAK